MIERIETLRREALDAVRAASPVELAALKSRLLGRKSDLKSALKSLGSLPPSERPRAGEAVNAAVREIEAAISAREAESHSQGTQGALDFTRPGFLRLAGRHHPIHGAIEAIEEIFLRLGYGIAEGPDIEDDAHNFSDLNFPPDHPARDAQDTFFLEPARAENPWLLRTHTSPVQIRVMEAIAPPLAVIVPGRTYRSDAPDATHSPLFHQVEGLVVGANITMADLKGTLDHFAKEFFGPEQRVRFRPSFFPFTEPSAEVDVSCVACDGSEASEDCRVCKGTGMLEVLGSGMVNPAVFEAVNRRRGDRAYDPERVTGFAFGMGVERLAMLKYGIDDMRLFFENDPRFLEMFL